MAAGVPADSPLAQALVTLAGAITQNQAGQGQLRVAASQPSSSTPTSADSLAIRTSRTQNEAENTSTSSRR